MIDTTTARNGFVVHILKSPISGAAYCRAMDGIDVAFTAAYAHREKFERIRNCVSGFKLLSVFTDVYKKQWAFWKLQGKGQYFLTDISEVDCNEKEI